MTKLYMDYLDEISYEDLYKGLLAYGLFADKLPPIFTSEEFYNYCESISTPFPGVVHKYIFFESMRNNGFPREFSIPNPMAYQKLCKCLMEQWDNIKEHFRVYTANQEYNVSRIHIRKIKNENALFEMNYSNWITDENPNIDLLFGNRYRVKTDISTFFPSIYSHAICWAIMGKENAKIDKKIHWANSIDKKCQAIRYGETHGLPIGPHASNLLSELILVVVDNKLYQKGYRFIRNVDDYECYTKTYEQAQQFISDLNEELRYFDLSINWKKTKIDVMPYTEAGHWTNKLKMALATFDKEYFDYNGVKAYLDTATQLEKENKDLAVYKYAFKTLSKKDTLTKNAKSYCLKYGLELIYMYPYLLSIADEYIFQPYNAPINKIEELSNVIYKESIKTKNYEVMYYALYYAIKYDYQIEFFNVNDIVECNNCILKLMALIYVRKNNFVNDLKKLKKNAKELKPTRLQDMDLYWLFVYECLPATELSGEWKPMKQAGVSFIKQEFRF